jgi:hypothetical protein
MLQFINGLKNKPIRCLLMSLFFFSIEVLPIVTHFYGISFRSGIKKKMKKKKAKERKKNRMTHT